MLGSVVIEAVFCAMLYAMVFYWLTWPVWQGPQVDDAYETGLQIECTLPVLWASAGGSGGQSNLDGGTCGSGWRSTKAAYSGGSGGEGDPEDPDDPEQVGEVTEEQPAVVYENVVDVFDRPWKEAA